MRPAAASLVANGLGPSEPSASPHGCSSPVNHLLICLSIIIIFFVCLHLFDFFVSCVCVCVSVCLCVSHFLTHTVHCSLSLSLTLSLYLSVQVVVRKSSTQSSLCLYRKPCTASLLGPGHLFVCPCTPSLYFS